VTQLSFIDPSTGLPVLTKQPGESRKFRFDFSNKLRSEGLASVVGVSITSQNLVVGSGAVASSSETASGRFVNMTLTGGTDNENYKISVVVTTTSGQVLEGDGILYCRQL
jgi:hypothetical protein